MRICDIVIELLRGVVFNGFKRIVCTALCSVRISVSNLKLSQQLSMATDPSLPKIGFYEITLLAMSPNLQSWYFKGRGCCYCDDADPYNTYQIFRHFDVEEPNVRI
jgi:hypothetical protein